MDDSVLVTAFQSNVSEMMSVQQGSATLSVLVLALNQLHGRGLEFHPRTLLCFNTLIESANDKMEIVML